jgi:hypothetical protein
MTNFDFLKYTTKNALLPFKQQIINILGHTVLTFLQKGPFFHRNIEIHIHLSCTYYVSALQV